MIIRNCRLLSRKTPKSKELIVPSTKLASFDHRVDTFKTYIDQRLSSGEVRLSKIFIITDQIASILMELKESKLIRVPL